MKEGFIKNGGVEGDFKELPEEKIATPETEEADTAKKENIEKDNLLNAGEVLASAERDGMIWRSISDRVLRQYETAIKLSSLTQFPGKDGKIECQVNNMRSLLNMAFLKKEHSQQKGDKFLECLYNSGSRQEFINLMLTEEGMAFNTEGENVNLEGYLKDYYKDLESCGFSIEIKKTEKLESAAGESLTMVILEDRVRGERKEIPVICAEDSKFLSNANAAYCYSYDGKKTIDDRILMKPIKKLNDSERSIPEIMGTLVHEVDHAIYNFLHESSRKRLEREYELAEKEINDLLYEKLVPDAVEENKEYFSRIEKLRNRRIEIKRLLDEEYFIKKVGNDIVFEGLARVSQRDFLQNQISGLAQYSEYKNGFAEGAALVNDYDTFLHQTFLEGLLYSTGEILVSQAIKKIPRDVIYRTDVLEKEIIDNPGIIKSIIRRLVLNRNQAVEELNKLREYPDRLLTETEKRILVKACMKGFASPFVLGKEYFDITWKVDSEVDSKEIEELKQEVEKFIEKNLGLSNQIIEKFKGDSSPESIRDMVKVMHFSMGELKQRTDEEFKKILEG